MVVVSRMGFVMNEWTKQRDLLIEETLAFVQGVAVNTSRIPSVQQAVEPKDAPARCLPKLRVGLAGLQGLWSGPAQFCWCGSGNSQQSGAAPLLALPAFTFRRLALLLQRGTLW